MATGVRTCKRRIGETKRCMPEKIGAHQRYGC